MEGSGGSEEQAAVWESLKINPELFLNETLNSVDDLLDDAFRFFHSEASKRLEIEGDDRLQKLAEGTAYVRNMVASRLDARLEMWKGYCLRHCFRVPEGFRLPGEEAALSFSKESNGESVFIQCLLADSDLDAGLESLREKVAKASKESAELTRELQALEKQSARKDHCSVLVNELLQLNEETFIDHLSHEMAKVESELRGNIEKLGSNWMESLEHKLAKRARNWDTDLLVVEHSKGLFRGKLREIETLLTDINSMSS